MTFRGCPDFDVKQRQFVAWRKASVERAGGRLTRVHQGFIHGFLGSSVRWITDPPNKSVTREGRDHAEDFFGRTAHAHYVNRSSPSEACDSGLRRGPADGCEMRLWYAALAVAIAGS
jgi:hypothetical protein